MFQSVRHAALNVERKMSGLGIEEADEEVWHLRRPLTSQNTSNGGCQSFMGDRTPQSTNRLDIPSDPLPDRTDTPFSPGESSFATRSFSILTGLRDTLSSVFHSPVVSPVSNVNFVCRVILLDGRSLLLTLEFSANGRDLLNRVASYLGLEQSDIFGLTYSLAENPPIEPDDDQLNVTVNQIPNSTDQSAPVGSDNPWSMSEPRPSDAEPLPDSTVPRRRRSERRTRTLSQSMRFGDLWKRNRVYVGDILFWLDLDKRISEQCEGPHYVFQFQVKYYLTHPDRDIYCPEARRQYCLQLRQHLLTGRLPCSFNTHVVLGAYISQFVLGDAHPRHLSVNDGICHSTRSSISSRRDSRAFSLSEAQSFDSERACSLAEPELSDLDWEVDNENMTESNNAHETGNVTWISQPTDPGRVPLIRRKCATVGHPGSETVRHSVDCSRSVRSELAHSTYLSVLPHLNRLSRSSSCGRPYDGWTENGVNGDLSVDDWSTIGRMSATEWNESPGANWPYPNPTGYYCPEMLKRIARLHRHIRGMPRSRAERRFLRVVKNLSMYGVELHLVKRVTIEARSTVVGSTLRSLYRSWATLRRSLVGQSHRELDSVAADDEPSTFHPKRSFVSHVQDVLPFDFNAYPEFTFTLGICSTGLVLYWGQLRIARFPWPRIVAVSLQRSHFLLTVRQAEEDSSQRLLCYSLLLSSSKLALHLFTSCVEQHRYFRLGKRYSHTPEAIERASAVSPTPVTTNPIRVHETVSVPESALEPEPSTPVSLPRPEQNRPAARQQRARIRHWFQCLIPRTSDSDPSEQIRPIRRRRRNTVGRSPRRAANPNPPDDDGCRSIELNVQNIPSEDTTDEPWLRRDEPGVHSSDIPAPNSEIGPGHRVVATSETERVPSTYSWWISRAVASRLNESPIVPTVRRVRSALSGTLRESHSRSTAPGTTRPVSFSAMHKRAVSTNTNRPVPPPRPKQPPTPSDGRQNQLTRSFTMSPSVNDSGLMTPNILANLDSIPLVPTYTAVFTPEGRMMQTSGLHRVSPMKDTQGNKVLLQLSQDDVPVNGSGPQQTSTPNHTKRTIFPSVIPIVPTRSVRFTFSLNQMNAYRILDSLPLKCVNGSCVPLVATKSVYLHYP